MLRHCSIQELLDVRNGEGSLGARLHVDECQECRDELDQLHQRVAALKALPSVNAPRDRWLSVREVVVSQRRRGWWMRTGWAAAAAAALFLGVTTIIRGGPAAMASEPEIELRTLTAQSARLDSLLIAVDAQRRVLNGLTAIAIADLEDRISLVDARIVAARQTSVAGRRMIREDQLRELLRHRVVLMDALVSTHVQRAAYVGF
jgi:hypothetical protein